MATLQNVFIIYRLRSDKSHWCLYVSVSVLLLFLSFFLQKLFLASINIINAQSNGIGRSMIAVYFKL